MRRDLDLIRKLMLAVEAHPSSIAPDEVTISGYDDDVVAYHRWLIVDAGLAVGSVVTDLAGGERDARIHSLNTPGHDFIDAARSDKVWAGAMQRAKVIGGAITLDVLVELLKDQVRKLLGL